MNGAFKLTWLAGVVELLQQREALLLGPVVNDSGQNVKVSRRKFTAEEISCERNGKKHFR